MSSFDSYIIDEQERKMRDKRMMDIDTWTPLERKIRDLIGEAEALGAHPMLTNVVVKLGEARSMLTFYYIEIVGDAPEEPSEPDESKKEG